ncbi:uncharacterized protein LOC62_02G002237 [Vanrija pseudolonga]|uniref:DSBA-like thioredoxin domain-containing protein n=1 Tax=Vanrija pseudolonga TaxID=143232 RepID=A0AAF0Y888_9TREE|nr:hypothetical protein LOC62_02G002237 [Vanrija pseudolonga]
MAAVARTLKVDVTSDVLCPFCYLGVKQLQAATKTYNTSHPTAPVALDIKFHAYPLSPDLTDAPRDRAEHMAKKFGAERVKAMEPFWKERFGPYGIERNPGGKVASSHLSHRLTSYAGKHAPASQLPLEMDLFDMYHARGIEPSNRAELSRLAVKNGVFPTEEAAAAFLDSTDEDADVRSAYSLARRRGIDGVPFFIFNDKFATSGAVGEDEFGEILDTVVKN